MLTAKNILTGTGWVGTTAYINAGVSFVGNIFLARLLMPNDFGIYALAASFLSLVFMISGFGTQESIVQCHENNIDELIPTAFWMTIVLGVVLALVGSLLGMLLMPRYGEIVALLIVLLSWVSLMSMISNAYGAILQRDLNYRPISITQLVGTFISFAVAILAAFRNYGIWSLFLREAIFTFFMLISLGWACGFRVPWKFNRRTAHWIWGFGWKIMGNRIAEVLFERVDKLIVGTFLGTATLGQYNVAYRLAWVGHQFSYGAIESLSFSVFANIQKEREKLRLAFEKMYYWLLRFALLLGLSVWFCGADLVRIIYGSKWEQAGSIFQNMAVLLMLLPLETSLRSFLVGAGHIDRSLRVRYFMLIFLVPAMLASAYWGGIIWLVWSINLSICLSWLIAIRLTSQVIPVKWSYLMRKPIIAGFITFVGVEAVGNLGHWSGNGLLDVIMTEMLLVLVFILLLSLFEHRSLRNEWTLIWTKLASH
jgi:O-antigen/teichoic acid export membrane protein